MSRQFQAFATSAAQGVGTPWAFLTAGALVLLWGLLGFTCDFNETWQLVANTSTTIITFLMMFLLQHTQNRDAAAINLKLDELIRITHARNIFADLEDATEEELEKFKTEFKEFRARELKVMEGGKGDPRRWDPEEDPTVKGNPE